MGVDYPNLDLLKRRDEDPWKSFSGQVVPKIRNIIRYILRNANEAVVDDITSETISWMVKSICTKDFKDVRHFEARAIIKGRSLAIDYIRRETKNPISYHENEESRDHDSEGNPKDHQSSPAEELAENELSDVLNNLLDAINPAHREVLKMIFLRDKTFREISVALDMPIGTIGTYRKRGLEEIKREIERHPYLLKDLNDQYGMFRLTVEIVVMVLLLK
jgi:RNA polymerase sigma factor (sigma-70 family)